MEKAEVSAAVAAAAAAVDPPAWSPARPATPPPQSPTAKSAAAAALSPASSVDLVDLRYSLDDDVDDQAEELRPEAPAELPEAATTAAQPPAEHRVPGEPEHATEASAVPHSGDVNVETWLQSLGLLMNQCPWEEAAAAEGAAASQSLLQPLLGLLRQLVAAARAQLRVEAMISTVVQVCRRLACTRGRPTMRTEGLWVLTV